MTPLQNESRAAMSALAASWSRYEELIAEFERAWQTGPPPGIDDYLQGNGSERISLLVELVHADLEFRVKTGESVRVESYLDRFPELARDDATVLELLDAEYRLRRRKESDVDLNEYAARFPRHIDELRTRFSGAATVAGADEIHGLSHSPREPASIPGYEIVKEIGRGGMGIIYQAKQARLKRHVALKFLPPDLVQDRSLLDRFVREAITASALNHPNICTIHELGEHEGRPFIVMEFIEGQTLRSIANLPTNPTEAARLIRQVARALAAAHAAGVVHRDIKPENIMVRADGYVKVLDFGLARRLPTLKQHDTQGANDTTPGSLLGTMAYMSPEQARGEVLGPSSDIFSLGVVFYQLVTGRHPFESDSAFSTLHAIAMTHPVPASRLNPEVQAGVDGIITSMLNKDAQLRPGADAIEAALASGAPRIQKRERAGGSAAIVHRRQELAALRTALAEAEAGRSGFVCVTGEPGIGKTTIVEDFLEGVREQPVNYQIACGRCTERQTETEAFLPIVDALTGLNRDDVSGAAPRLMKVLAPTWHAHVVRSRSTGEADSSRATSQHAMLREFCAFLEELSRLTPVVLFIDDLHWADASTVELLAYLGHHLHRLRLLVVVTFRPTEMLLGPHPFHHIRLELAGRGVCKELPLSFLERHQVDGYLSLAFPRHAFPPDFAELIHTRTEGSPLFMVDLLRYLREQGVIQKVQGVWSLARDVPDFKKDLPESVRSMIQRKLEQLGNEDRRLLSAASIQGYEFDSTAVAAVVDRDAETVEERLKELQRVHGLVRLLREDQFPNRKPTQRFAFVHVLYQQALYADITPTRRASLSLALARLLERYHESRSSESAAEIACLFEAGCEFGQAARYFHFAAQNAAKVFAHRDAIVLARRGLRLLEALPASPARDELELPLQMTLGLQLQMTDGYAADSAKQAYDRARNLCPPSQEKKLFPILWGQWLYFKVSSRLPRAQVVADELLALACQLNDPDLAIQAHQALGLTALCRGKAAVALRHVEQVATLYDPERHRMHAFLFGQDPGVICKAYGAVALLLLGYADAARRQSEEALELSRHLSPTSQSVAQHFAAMVYQLLRNPARARQCADASAAIATEHGLSFWLAGGHIMSGWAICSLGDASQGIEHLRQGLLDWQATGSVTYRTYYLGLLAEALDSAGQFEQAQHVLDEALSLIERTDERFYEAELHRLRGELLLRMSSNIETVATGSAEQAFHQAIAISQQQDAKWLQLRAATSLVRLRRRVPSPGDSDHLLAEICASFTQGFDTPDVCEALTWRQNR